MTGKSSGLRILILLLACFGASGVATAAGRDCSPIGTWFGVDPVTHVLTGWVSIGAGQSNDAGTTTTDFVTFDPTLGNNYPTAVRGSLDSGVWRRTGANTFKYSFMGFAVDSSNTILFVARVTGTFTLIDDCRMQRITGVMAIYDPTVNPFEEDPLFEFPVDDAYGYRYTLP